ncbi:MAG: 50S ribosomal protein L21 [Nitrospirota bacterium]|mgnify:CR=1 FL=1
MIAVIETGGKQYRVAPGDSLRVEKLNAREGDTVEIQKVLAVGQGKDISLEKSSLEKAKVLAEVISHGKADKIIVFKMKRRKNYRRTRGHRQPYTQIKIKEIKLGG